MLFSLLYSKFGRDLGASVCIVFFVAAIRNGSALSGEPARTTFLMPNSLPLQREDLIFNLVPALVAMLLTIWVRTWVSTSELDHTKQISRCPWLSIAGQTVVAPPATFLIGE